jgi:hypothetical protein
MADFDAPVLLGVGALSRTFNAIKHFANVAEAA